MNSSPICNWKFSWTLTMLLALAGIETRSAHGQINPVVQATSPNISSVSVAAFDVAVIRQNNSDQHARSHIYNSPANGEFKAVNVTLIALLRYAFGLPETQILGGPGELRDEKFDIEAKSDSAVDERLSKLTASEARLEKQSMLQALFAERFKLAVHPEARELPAYALVVAKSGPKLKGAKADGTMIDAGRGTFVASGIPVAVLAEQLAKETGRVVQDQTGVSGRYDITLRWTSGEDAALSSDATAGSIFTALQEQLGLKLEPRKLPTPVLVIDHVEAPSAN